MQTVRYFHQSALELAWPECPDARFALGYFPSVPEKTRPPKRPVPEKTPNCGPISQQKFLGEHPLVDCTDIAVG
jgi:hypothetical protein